MVLACVVNTVLYFAFNFVFHSIQSPFFARRLYIKETSLAVIMDCRHRFIYRKIFRKRVVVMNLFAIGDTHLSFGKDKPMDIFKGWDNYVERLEKQWNAVVTDDDTVVINGDISWAMKLSECYEDFKFLNELNGKKIILKGNHDYWWTTLNKMNNYLKENDFSTISILFNNSYSFGDYAVCGTRGWFYDSPESDKKVILRERQRLIRSIECGLAENKEPIVFLHYPPVYDERVCEEIYSVLTEYKIKRCYFGHIHGEKTGKYDHFERDNIKFALISGDWLKFCPKLIEKA